MARKRRAAAVPPSSVAEALRRDLAAMDERAPGVSSRAEALLAIELARRIEDRETTTTAAAAAAARLLDALEVLNGLAPERVGSPLDEILARRDARVARLPAAEGGAGAGRGRAS